MKKLTALIFALAILTNTLGILGVTAAEITGSGGVMTVREKDIEEYLESFVTDEGALLSYKERIKALSGEALEAILSEAENTYLGGREILKYEKTAAVTSCEIIKELVSDEGISLGDTSVLSLSGDTLKGKGLGRAIIKTGGTLKAIKVEKAPIALVLISGQSNAAGDYSDYTLAPKAVGSYEDKYMITNSMNCTLSDAHVTYEDAVYTAENGGRSQYASEGLFDSNRPELTWESRKLSAGPASALGARLSDEWDMKVWVVNTGICAQVMDSFDPENAGHSAYTKTVKYINKVKSLIEENGHFILDESKTGLFWLQGESDGIGTKSENTMEEYTRMFTNMYNGFVSEFGLKYAGIWLVRSGLNSNGDIDFYMSGPRLSQYYLGNSDKEEHKNIYLIVDTDIWRTNEGVKSYFDTKYKDSAAFEVKYGYPLPQTIGKIKPDIHHRQEGYNELGDEAGENIQSILYGHPNEPVGEGHLNDYYGNEAMSFNLELGGDNKANVAVPIVDSMNFNASAGLYVRVEDDKIATYDNDTFMFTPLKEGTTKAKLYYKTKLLKTYDVFVAPGKIKYADRKGWSISASSEWTAAGRSAKNLLDGNMGTSYTADITLTPPHEFEIDLGKVTEISGFAFDPYEDSSNTPTGYPTEYELYGKGDSGDYALIMSGTFKAETGVKREVSFGFNVEVRKIKFVVKKTYNNLLAMAEFNLLLSEDALSDKKLSENTVTEENVRMVGRYYEENGVLHSSFTSSGLEFKFKGTSASLKLNAKGNYDAYIHVFIDGDETVYKNCEQDNRIMLKKGEQIISLCEGLPEGEHTIKIVKANEESKNQIAWISIDTDGALLTPPALKERKIQFFGDSFTAGYNNMNFPDNNDSKDFGTKYQDGELTYAGYIARALNADSEVYARSGVGAYSMFNPQMFGYRDYYSDASYMVPERGSWDHSKFEPDVIVQYNWINDVLGSMDRSGRTVEQMTVAYLNMITKFRTVHPNAKIVIVGYSERPEFTALVNDAIARYGALGGDNSGIAVCETSYYGNHPKPEKAEEIANEIIPVIKELTGWN